MGYALFILFDQSIPGVEGWDMCGKVLARNIEQLDKVAKHWKFKTLTEMISVSREQIESLVGDEVEGSVEECWFIAQDGLATVVALTQFVQENPSQFYQVPQLLEDLARVKQYLEIADQYNVRFHLTPDF